MIMIATGSTAGLSGNAGSYQASYSYLPFGQVQTMTGTAANPFQYNGKLGVMTVGAGLDYMRLRFYSPANGRFVNADPTGLQAGQISTCSHLTTRSVLVTPREAYGAHTRNQGLGQCITQISRPSLPRALRPRLLCTRLRLRLSGLMMGFCPEARKRIQTISHPKTGAVRRIGNSSRRGWAYLASTRGGGSYRHCWPHTLLSESNASAATVGLNAPMRS